MPDATPLYGLPYPIDADSVRAAVKDIPKSLAQQLETTLASGFGGLPQLTTWTTLTPLVGTNAGGTLRDLGYRKIGAVVETRGRINGTFTPGTIVYVMPVGFRPTGVLTMVVASGSGYARIDVQPSGNVIVQDNASAFVNLDGLEWSVDTGTPPAAVAGGTVTGAGVPEGVVTAPVAAKYIDTAATRGAVEWIKRTGTGNTGWRVSWGDTGWRNVTALLSTPPVSGTLQLRRVNDEVTMRSEGITNPAWTGANLSLAVGSDWRAGATLYIPMWDNSALIAIWNDAPLIRGNPTYISGEASYRVNGDVPWPTTLPGTAV